MTIYVDLYYTMRSPYCYLATPTLAQLVKQYDLFFNLYNISFYSSYIFCKKWNYFAINFN